MRNEALLRRNVSTGGNGLPSGEHQSVSRDYGPDTTSLRIFMHLFTKLAVSQASPTQADTGITF